jgi:hypothetical protein
MNQSVKKAKRESNKDERCQVCRFERGKDLLKLRSREGLSFHITRLVAHGCVPLPSHHQLWFFILAIDIPINLIASLSAMRRHFHKSSSITM